MEKSFGKSGPLLTGEYVLSINSPYPAATIPNQRFFVKKGSRIQLSHRLFKKQICRFPQNLPEALFTLETKEGAIIGEGKGFSYTFHDLDPGSYLIRYSNSDSLTLCQPLPKRKFP